MSFNGWCPITKVALVHQTQCLALTLSVPHHHTHQCSALTLAVPHHLSLMVPQHLIDARASPSHIAQSTRVPHAPAPSQCPALTISVPHHHTHQCPALTPEVPHHLPLMVPQHLIDTRASAPYLALSYQVSRHPLNARAYHKHAVHKTGARSAHPGHGHWLMVPQHPTEARTSHP
jgi:hypothetical protein